MSETITIRVEDIYNGQIIRSEKRIAPLQLDLSANFGLLNDLVDQARREVREAIKTSDMGFYINTNTNKGKAKALIALGASPSNPFEFDPSGKEVLVCVVNNGPFEAAAIAFDKLELDVFNSPLDDRLKEWLKMPQTLARQLCPGYDSYLNAKG